MQPKEFNAFRKEILSLLWRQWSALGVAGQTEKAAASLVDPEALLLCSFSIARYDARLFDEIIDWLVINGAFINTQRLAAIQDTYSFSSGPQLSAIAEYLSHDKEFKLKWKRLSSRYESASVQPLFFTVQGKPLPVGENKDEIFLSKNLIRNRLRTRELSSEFPRSGIPSLLLRLRALIGISARCELLCILAGTNAIHPAEAARLSAYNRKTMQNALSEMASSGFIETYTNGRMLYYKLSQSAFREIIPNQTRWISWAPLYKGIEILWSGLQADTSDPLLLSSEYRRIAKEAKPFFEESKTGIVLTDPSRTTGEAYLKVFEDDLVRIVREIDHIV